MRKLLLLLVIFILSGCGGNPLTENPLLRGKKISWSGSEAAYFEFIVDGTLISVAGSYPLEGYKGQQWESVDDKGSFKVIPDPARAENYQIARMDMNIAEGGSFVFEYYEGGVKIKEDDARQIEIYEDLAGDHRKKAVSLDSRGYIFRYAHDTYIMDLAIKDPEGIVKKVISRGDGISTEVMMTNARQWNIEPLVEISKGRMPVLPVAVWMEIIYYDGKREKLSLELATVSDRSRQVYDDVWF